MKLIFKTLLISFATVAFAHVAHSQDLNILNHLSVGVNLGTTGVGVDVAVPVTKFISVRPGYNYVPKFSPKPELDVNLPMAPSSAQLGNIPSSVEFQGDLQFSGAKLLVDLYPFYSSGFHITAGAFFGKDEIVNLYNTQPGILKDAAIYNQSIASAPNSQKIGVELGDYFLTPDNQGNVQANFIVKKVRPYVGLGFGRAIPGHAVGFMFELGAMFWGKPSIVCNGIELEEDKVGDGDAGKIIKTISKVSVYPVINFRLCGKLF